MASKHTEKMLTSLILVIGAVPSNMGCPSGLAVKNPPEMQEPQETQNCPWVGKIRWSRAWQPTTVFLPGESHGQSSLVGYSPQG